MLLMSTFLLFSHLFRKHRLSRSFPCSVFVLLTQMVAWGMLCGFYGGCWFFSFSEIFLLKHLSCSLAFTPSLPTLSLLTPCSSPTSEKPREIDKQQDRGNWAILFLLWEPHIAAFIWKLSFSTSLGKTSHRPVTCKCLCWSIVPGSYWHAHWQLSLSTGIRKGSDCKPFRLLERQGRPRMDIDTVNGDGLLSTQGRCIR